ncbi:putative quinol monooxygenase [Halalkalibacter sp. APA_J-10(15)]|uniref:putative quinol monooxygenase n=1 Tax=unclassified Halalkalibacter TaxID=2893063 RepID=UPI001FF175BD|nr:putative quinol monooxygenase [Halalkalibacter sp. APA_J-10(15)]MCK0472426.1 antibiotic biosynthesis monooxygenase [Halalkalibacter sp. APA_J-10(15)]
MYIIHAFISVKREQREHFLRDVQPLIKHSQAEEGNIRYELYEQSSADNQFIMVEEWKSKEAIEFHFQTKHFVEFGAQSKDYMATPPQIKQFAVRAEND